LESRSNATAQPTALALNEVKGKLWENAPMMTKKTPAAVTLGVQQHENSHCQWA
jgi:hypothetical protein